MFINVLFLSFLESLNSVREEGVLGFVSGLYLGENVTSLSLSLWGKPSEECLIGKIPSPE